MRQHRNLVAAVTGALMIGSCLAPAMAAGVSVGGVSVSVGGNSSGGTTAAASVGGVAGGVGATATIGGGGGNVATGTVSTGHPATSTTVSIGTNGGPLAAASTDGQTTGVAINLGALGSILGSVPSIPGDGVTPGDDGTPGNNGGDDGAGNGNGGNVSLVSAFGSLGAGEQQALKVKCRNVLARPGSFAANVVTLCRMIASL